MSKQQVRYEHPNAFHDRVVLWTGGVLGTITMIMLVIIFGGKTFKPARDAIGLSEFMADESGVYADCSDYSNRHNNFCNDHQAGVSATPRRQRTSPKDFVPFGLNDSGR